MGGGGIDRRAAILLGASREDLPPRRPLVSNDRMFVRLRRLPTDFRSPPRFFRTLAEISPEKLPARGKEGRSTLFASSGAYFVHLQEGGVGVRVEVGQSTVVQSVK